MYSGTTLNNKSGNWIGAHQRIDRIARRHLTPLLKKGQWFPSAKEILHFEGNNGPDGIKRKSPSVDEPWHFIDPTDQDDRKLLEIISDHQVNLARALRTKNQQRAAFEAAWLAHAVVDGLTPAHHVPLGEMIEELFGIPHTERRTIRQKNVIKGRNRRDTLVKNWQYWGKHGIFMTHFMFEMGVATSILGRSYKEPVITAEDINQLKEEGYEAVFRSILDDVLALNTYHRYEKTGWTMALSRTVQTKLMPLIIKAVALAWYDAARRSKVVVR